MSTENIIGQPIPTRDGVIVHFSCHGRQKVRTYFYPYPYGAMVLAGADPATVPFGQERDTGSSPGGLDIIRNLIDFAADAVEGLEEGGAALL
jgi:hypothetical protein